MALLYDMGILNLGIFIEILLKYFHGPDYSSNKVISDDPAAHIGQSVINSHMHEIMCSLIFFLWKLIWN